MNSMDDVAFHIGIIGLILITALFLFFLTITLIGIYHYSYSLGNDTLVIVGFLITIVCFLFMVILDEVKI